MSGNDKNISLYSASDIQKYLRGELSAPEMHQLELAALEDPFLSDALEGMGIHHSLPAPSSLQQDLGELQKRLDDRVGKKDRKGYLLFRSSWKVAAAVILLAGLGLTAYFTSLTTARSRKVESVAQKTQTPQIPATADSIALEDRAVAKQQDVAAPREQATAKKAAPSPEPAILPGTAADIAQAAPAKADNDKADKEIYTSKERAKAYDYKTKSSLNKKDTLNFTNGYVSQDKQAAAPASTPAPSPAGASATAPAGNVLARRTAGLNITSPSEQLVFTGKVIDQNKNPLPGAALYLAGNGNYTFNTTTDKNGFFSLKLPKKDSAFKLTVASLGYEQASLGLSMENRTGNIIQLQPQANAMNEVVVTGFGTKRKEILQDNSEPRKDFLSKKAAPADGWPAYQSFLEVSKQAINPDSTLKGNETISFIVNKEGALSSFKVEQSLSPAHDSAVIQLIRQGPSWKLLKGKKTRAWVTILF
ncbi:MAG TPA: carboxypeptidase-like regulatory domain-containing protein [Puia sp.]|nr:carboxypeptidase-like regulatory domain-containing protein [Puia sp.]